MRSRLCSHSNRMTISPTRSSKKSTFEPDFLDIDSPSLESATGTEIDWKPGKNLCVKEIQKKQKAKSGKRKGEVRTITTREDAPSFFNFFKDPKEVNDDEDQEEDDDDEKISTHLDAEEDYEISHAIRVSLIPESIMWYTGENAEEEDEEDYDDDYYKDDDDDDDGD